VEVGAQSAHPNASPSLLTKFIAAPGLADEMGRKARAYVETNWSMPRAIDAIERHLGEVAALHPGTSATR
jgi:hypothetical protein